MLTQEQKDKIAELAAERDRALYAEEARRTAETAARRAANLVHWQPVLDAARAALPDWLDGGRLEPNCPEADLSDRWVKLAQEGNLYHNYNASVDFYDANDDHILTIVLCRKPDAWTPETYRVIDGAGHGRYSYPDLESALLRLPTEDAKRQETRAADEYAAEEDDETTYAEYKSHEIKAAQDAEKERRAQFESEVNALMEAAEQCISNAENNLNSQNPRAEAAARALHFSLAQSAAAIARILNDWRLTAREYAQENF